MYYLNCFFVYSILGYFFETAYAFITKSNFKSGILYGPITPIYGIGTIVILILSEYFFKNLHMSRWIESIIVFFILGIFLSCIELFGGIIIEKTFNTVFWSYKDFKYNIGDYISLEMTFVWGIVSVLFIYIINPLLKNIIKKIPVFITVIITILFIIDIIITILKKY